MKELSTEEKAKAYNGNYKAYTELINRLEDVKEAIKKQNYGIAMDVLCKPYPDFQVTTHSELKESEDERVRNKLIKFFKGYSPDKEWWGNITQEDILAWLEKQGEQNLVRHFCDCVHVGCHVNDCKRWCHSYQKEISYTDCNSNCNRYSKLMNPAFNIGETITDGISTFKIADIKDNYYIADDGEKVEIYMAHRYYTIIQNMEVQKPAECTAEDEKTIVKIRDFFIRVFCDKPDFTEDKRYEEFIEFIDNRLKSLKERYTWKPSDEQMEGIECTIKTLRYQLNAGDNRLDSLYNDLKKLRGE